MSAEAWFFLVGLRVVDVGALVFWLVWFFHLKDEEPGDREWDDEWGDGPSGPDAPEPSPPGPGSPGRAKPWRRRRRDHTGDRPPARISPRRRAPARRRRAPARR